MATELIQFTWDGVTRDSYLDDPLPGVAGRPLVIALHAGLSNPQDFMAQTGLTNACAARGWSVVYPRGRGVTANARTFNAGHCCGFARNNNVDDVGFIDELLNVLEGQIDHDVNRVYATGFSNGAMMCYKLACEMTGRLAAIAPGSGSMDPALTAVATPLCIMHGLLDTNVPWEGGVGPDAVDPVDHQSGDDTIALWLAALGLTGVTPNLGGDGTIVQRQNYGLCNCMLQVNLSPSYAHVWNVGDFSRTDAALSFFARHSL